MVPPSPSRSERLAATGWALVLLGCLALLAGLLSRGAPLDTRITALLPETDQTTLLERAERRLTQAVEDRFVILVSGEHPIQLVRDLGQRLREADGLTVLDGATFGRPDDALAPYRYRLLTETLATADDAAWEQRALTRLFTPGLDSDPRRDPFGLLDAWLAQRLKGPIHLVDGLPTVDGEDRRWFVVTGQLAASPYDMGLQRRLTDALADFHRAHPGAEMLRAGLIFHAAAGASQAKREISTIGLGSLLGISLLLWVVFRRAGVLASLLLPIGCGLLFALPLSWAIFGTLNLLTLAFGASLIGVAVDYALHLQCARQLTPGRPLSRLWPGLWLGLISSLAAYLVQLATPLPGLRQMATFAALGLLGAWLTVRLWLPLLPPRPHHATASIATGLDRLRLPAQAPRRWGALILLGGLAGVLIITRLTTSDDLRQLNPSPASLIAEQQRVQALLERTGASHYLVVSADQESELLERLEALEPSLSSLQRSDHLAHYRHLAQAVPSPATQRSNLARTRHAYAAALPHVIKRAGLPPELLGAARQPLDTVPILSVETWLKMPVGRADSTLWLGEVGGGSHDEEEMTALVTLGDADAVARRTLAELADRPGVQYRDRVAALSDQLARLRDTIAGWLAAAVAGLSLLFGWRYRRAAWRVLLPPLGALVATLAVFAALGTGLTLFHLLGLLLVLGIGLDAGIFSAEHPASPSAWLAISLSCASSLLAFGLLAFSATPALHYLGMSCLIGLAATWALVPFARADSQGLAPEHAAPRSGH